MKDQNFRLIKYFPHVHRNHWGFDYPAREEGTEEEIWAVFKRVRDETEACIQQSATSKK